MADVQDIGPLDWRVSIVDKSGRPSPEFQRRWNANRGNSAQIGTISFGSGPPSGTPSDGALYADTSELPFVLYVGQGGTWDKAGIDKFTELDDTPDTYTGQALKLLRVAATEDALEFVVPPVIPVGANPSAIAKDTAVNGVATTWMRSDAAPAIQKASASQFGLVKVDGTTVTSVGGVISAAGGSGPSPVNPPVFSDFTFVLNSNASGAGGSVAQAETVGCSVFQPARGGGDYVAELQKAVTTPTGDWSVTLGFHMNGVPQGYDFYGLTIMDSSGKRINNAVGSASRTLRCLYWNDINSFAAEPNYYSLGYPAANGIDIWFRTEVVGSTMIHSFSYDGKTFLPWFSKPQYDFIGAPAKVGMCCALNGQPFGAKTSFFTLTTVGL